MGNKFGWHSGTLTCQEARVKGDLYVQDDIVFSDVSAGVLGITGGIDMSGTTSAIGITMTGGTFSTSAIQMGSSSSAMSISSGQIPLDINTTTTDTSGTIIAVNIKHGQTVATYANQTEVLVAEIETNYLTGDWANAIVARIDYASTGNAGGGMAAPLCSELNYPAMTPAGGSYAVIDLEMNCPSGFTSTVSPSWNTWINFGIWGNATAIASWEDYGFLFRTDGFTGAAGNMISAGNSTIRVSVENSSGTATTAYMLLSSAENCLSFAHACTTGITLGGAMTTGMLLSGATTTGINITGNATDGIKIQTGTFTDAIEIAGTTTNGINIGPCTTAGINIAGGTAAGSAILVGTSTTGTQVDGTPDYAVEIYADIPTGAVSMTGQNLGTTNNRLTIAAAANITSDSFATAAYNRIEIKGGNTDLGLGWYVADLGYLKNPSGTVDANGSNVVGVCGLINVAADYAQTTGGASSEGNGFTAAFCAGSMGAGTPSRYYGYAVVDPGTGGTAFTAAIGIWTGAATTFLSLPAAAPWSATNAADDGGKIAILIGGATKYINVYNG